ncbi:MAG TPA: DoxX family protein [Tepidisphaeraceae bacterium]
MIWTGRIISTVMVLILLMDAVMKFMKPKFVVEGTIKLGYQEDVIVGLGIVLTACTILYIIPRTAVLGAILLTGYLGGAVASHLRAGQGPFPMSFAITFGVLIWLGLVLRDSRLRMLIPLRR